ncbi:MAG: hypothetical protein P4M08_03765 [Oligoflexia bacterium]|nr:hypothetical protein [Oligoflexia bacterium]
MTTLIFREMESAIARAKSLEEALKATQDALLRGQVELELRLRSMPTPENTANLERIRELEKQIAALKAANTQQLAREKAAIEKNHALEQKLAAASSKNNQLTQQLKAGSLKWNELVAKVKAQNEKIEEYWQKAENDRFKLSQELAMEKARHIEIMREIEARKVARPPAPQPVLNFPIAAQTPAPVAAVTSLDRAQKQREQITEMLKQSQARLAEVKKSSAPDPARAQAPKQKTASPRVGRPYALPSVQKNR